MLKQVQHDEAVVEALETIAFFSFKLCLEKIYRCIEGSADVGYIILVQDCNAEDG